MNSREAVLVDVPTLSDELSSPRPPVLLDVRWELGDPHGRAHYEAGHLPGAVFVDLDTELSGPPSVEAGRHPLPRIEDLQAAARRWGLTRDRAVVVYDDTGGRAAARAWWLLRWAGQPTVRLLDGGLGAWRAAGHEVATGSESPAAGDVVLTAGQQPTLDADQAGAWPRTGVLLDARPGDRYRGEVEPLDARPGHIPGALSAPTAGNLDATATFRSADELAAHYAELGVDGTTPVAVYCGSGVTAAHDAAALASIGIEVSLYPGSWSAWSGDPRRPAELGAAPGSAEDQR